MPLNHNAFFGKKKEFISFLLSILVFFIHSYFAPDIVSSQFISVANHKVSYFFSRSITQFAVPMFFMLSAISFFNGYDNKQYVPKMKRRLFTLVIPYLLWNTIWTLWELFTSLLSADASHPLTLTSILKGIFFYNCNFPFWFIFDLIVFSFAAPLVFWIIKNKYVGIASVIGLSIASLFGIHLPVGVFYYPMAIVFYLIGAIIGYHHFDFICKKSSKPAQIASFAFLAAYILTKNIVPQELHIDNYFTQTMVYTLAAYSLWNVTDAFIERIKPRAIYGRSFAVYAMHLHIGIVILKLFSFCTPQTEWFEIPKFIVMIVSTLIIIQFACTLLERFAPRLYATLMGTPKKKEQAR